ncbi:MAG: phosphoenolpyruvate carboxykinase (ATP) [Anaerolineales bacterium]|jgi:phosphoenolpyruvate carboxykinase (ATP)
MLNAIGNPSRHGLENHGLRNLGTTHWTLPSAMLVEQIIQRREGQMAHLGPVVVRTGHLTGRSPNDKFIVSHDRQADQFWWGKINRPMTPERFDHLLHRMSAFFQGRDVFVQDAAAAANPKYRLPIRIVSDYAWHSLFARNIFLRLPPQDLPGHVPEFTILVAPRFHAIPDEDGTNSEIFIVLDFERSLVLIGGTSYAGEIKKAVFTVMNYLLPRQNVLSMHCSANVGSRGDVALFFGLSGTGKTTLSSDVDRRLIGDDEHGWSEEGIFNLEGGCYAKTIHLRADLEPIIWEATRRFGTVLENVALDVSTRRIDFDDRSITENTRAGYPLGFVENHVEEGTGVHPKNIFFLTADASGILPPIARLSTEQAMYHFLSGYTSKLGETESGLGSEPQITFSTCFGAPFLPLPPSTYGHLLEDRLRRLGAQVWLVNTGWTGGPFGVGDRIPMPYTRALIRAALAGELESVPTQTLTPFELAVPKVCPGVPTQMLDPRGTWTDPAAYDLRARKLAEDFVRNFSQFEKEVAPEVKAAGPRLGR